MVMFGPVGFALPWLLWALVALPILWFILRAIPPAPIRRRFPGVALLLGLTDDESLSDKTPWWLLLLRMLAVAAIIIGFAGPVLNPESARSGDGPLMIVVDGTWADARDWRARQDRIAGLLAEAGRAGRPVAVMTLTEPDKGPVLFQAAGVWAERLAGVQPRPWEPNLEELENWLAELGDAEFETFWISDGLERSGRAELLESLETYGAVTVFEGENTVHALRPVVFEDGVVKVEAIRSETGEARDFSISAIGLDPSGQERELARADLRFGLGEETADVAFSLPPELRNRISRFALVGVRSAAAVTLADDSLRRREVALIAGREDREGLELLSPLHYLKKALVPTADLIDGVLSDVLLANPDVIVLADVATLSEGESRDVAEWVAKGGLLLRFAGPRLAASDISRDSEDILMPVRLRRGGRSVGGAMSWGSPKGLLPFAEDTVFYGLEIPDDVRVNAQVVAQPDPELAERVIASLTDGTPLVTRKALGDGQVVLFHVTANAEWSTLPLSGLFVGMLERLAVSSGSFDRGEEDLASTTWVAEKVLDAFGQLDDAGAMAGIAGETLAAGKPMRAMPPGLYASRDRRIALNAIDQETELKTTSWPVGQRVEGLGRAAETALKSMFLMAALLFLLVDIFASLGLAGRLRGPRVSNAAAVLLCVMLIAPEARAQDDFAIIATSEVVLAHVITGNGEIDRVARAGLVGLSQVLNSRTSIEPAPPISIDLERDELSFFPFLYWPVTPDQPLPSDEAYGKLNRYLRNGGMILFDTRDSDIAGGRGGGPNGQKLQQLAWSLDIPPLERVPADHVLTRTFYLLQDFPGRYASRNVWVEAAPPDAEQVEGMPFRNLNDGVTPVVIGGNDWASAWAVDDGGNRMFPIGRGYAGERQREIAKRFGVNLIMHVLTGNYKSDQVHVPALLDRLGQ
ncbi:DUF4159 domain-containing protein [Pseudohalocynthiibacter aestuariivivens]|uniref:DUF4159 domain-containing protein n=1 Tax=Pseudohalocynthiibacter aestuariivivens TaxID=1591409 RepID=A0ABV5JBG8_9RHOB|nr:MULTISPECIES: DUF4159 domain-containing protein [Pseudohalocynthiibacter]MBS9715642.1 DUF4159 domain-containing protein [Pseudohalocynthiibacter aestuariivivens]MCK0101255.1 DUF4159 domain-containing protein [Pseudohalocynthiibacter sp. F2068]